MQKRVFIKVCLLTALATTGIVALYELSDQLLAYHYFSYQYYIAGVAAAALAAGVLLTNRYYKSRSAAKPAENAREKLTAKELHVLEQIAAGRTNKEIAALNYIEMSTVKTHINNIYAKLGVKNRTEALNAYQMLAESQKSTLSPPTVI